MRSTNSDASSLTQIGKYRVSSDSKLGFPNLRMIGQSNYEMDIIGIYILGFKVKLFRFIVMITLQRPDSERRLAQPAANPHGILEIAKTSTGFMQPRLPFMTLILSFGTSVRGC